MSNLLLLSGGIDSIAIAYWLRPEKALTVNYGQASAYAEVKAAQQICNELNIQHSIIDLSIKDFGMGDLSGNSSSVKFENSEFWPYRNQFLLTVAAMAAVKKGSQRVLIGTVISDQRHLDGTRFFIDKTNELISFQEGNIVIEAPAIDLTSAELVFKSTIPMSVLSWAHSCHVGNLACGRCRGCIKHSEVMSYLGQNR